MDGNFICPRYYSLNCEFEDLQNYHIGIWNNYHARQYIPTVFINHRQYHAGTNNMGHINDNYLRYFRNNSNYQNHRMDKKLTESGLI